MFYKKLAMTLPLIAYIFLLIWPDQITNIESNRFPIVPIGPYHIRVSEIYFILLILVYGFKQITNRRIKKPAIDWERRRGPAHGHRLQGDKLEWAAGITVMLMIIVSLIRGIASNNHMIALEVRGLSYWLFVPLMMYAVSRKSELLKQVKNLYWVLTILALANFISIVSGMRISLFQSNNLSLILILYLACLSIAHYILSGRKPALHLIIFLFALITSLLSLSKSMVLGGATIVFMSFIYVLIKNKQKGIYLLAAYILLIMAIIYGYKAGKFDLLAQRSSLFAQYQDINDFYENRIRRADIGDISGGRFDMWRYLVSQSRRSIIIGSGLGIQGEIMDRYYDEGGGYIREHNLFIYVFLRWGILGLFIMLFLCQRMIGKWVRRLNKTPSYEDKLLLLAHLLFIVVFLIINMVGLYFTYFETAICFWFSIAVCLISSQGNERRVIRKTAQI